MRQLSLLIVSILFVAGLKAQTDSVQKPPYLKFPTYPPVKLLNKDSSTYFTKDSLAKKKAVLLMIFNPDCHHCQTETEDIINNIGQFKDVQIVMTTMMPFDSMRNFIKKYDLGKYKNIVVTQDQHFFLPSFFMIKSLPFLAFYDRHKKLITTFEGSMPIERVWNTFK